MASNNLRGVLPVQETTLLNNINEATDIVHEASETYGCSQHYHYLRPRAISKEQMASVRLKFHSPYAAFSHQGLSKGFICQ